MFYEKAEGLSGTEAPDYKKGCFYLAFHCSWDMPRGFFVGFAMPFHSASTKTIRVSFILLPSDDSMDDARGNWTNLSNF
jgi:hypothetical protein